MFFPTKQSPRKCAECLGGSSRSMTSKLMRLSIDHTTTFDYREPVSEAYTEVRLKPQEDSGQHCLSFRLSVEPRCEVFQYTDFHGNDVRYFDILPSHERLTVRAVSQVVTSAEFQADARELSLLERFDYLQPTRFTPVDPAVQALLEGRDFASDAYAAALELMHAVHGRLRYEKGATSVATTAAEALELGCGVCQDFTHVMLAACRAAGVPARYVSGYLHTAAGQDAAQATHAWVDAHIEGRGWVSLDPTHDMRQSEYHVRVAVGRDYSDVTPTRGLYTGTSLEELGVVVRVDAV